MAGSKGLNLKAIPQEVKRYLIRVQADTKINKGIGQYSLEKTIYQIILEHQKQNEKQAKA